MTAAEAARILVESIDVNIPDDSIKYGFQSFDQEFVDEPALRRANSVGVKIRDTLQRTHSGLKEQVQRTNSGVREPLQRANSGSTESLQRTNSGLRDTLQRSNRGVTPFRMYSRQNSRSDSGRSSSTADLTKPESDLSGLSSHTSGNTGKTLESMMQLMHTMVESIGKLQQDVTELKARRYCLGGCCTKISDQESLQQASPRLKKKASFEF
ncbi:unnamed protein product [Phytophthora lilii]|uniref:Unnamed protein product n=1 Tax=Phytophthora lilii TaxID=2077276 RepID=A0A9W6TH48_9STRA|nr:unnamed protein product [Phytophthora lilii]